MLVAVYGMARTNTGGGGVFSVGAISVDSLATATLVCLYFCWLVLSLISCKFLLVLSILLFSWSAVLYVFSGVSFIF